MRFDDVDPDERDDALPRRRRRRVLVGVAVTLAGLGVGAFFVIRNRADKPVAAPAATVAGTAPDTVPPAPDVPFVAAPPGPNDFPDFGSDYQGDKLEVLAKRTTPDGIAVTLQKIDWGGFQDRFGGGIIVDGPTRAVHPMTSATTPPPAPVATVPVSTAEPVQIPAGTAPLPPGFPQDSNGWIPPDWCNASSGLRVTMSHGDSIGTAQAQLFDGVANDVMATMFSSGYAEGHPFRVLVLQVSKAVTLASVRFPDGAQDHSIAENGFVILASMGKAVTRFGLTLTVDGVERDVLSTELVQQGNAAWIKGCTPPPPVLPAAGEQPSDAAGAEALVRERFGLLFDQSVAAADKPADLLDDRTGVDDALTALASGPFGDASVTAEYAIDELVFTSPTEAWFRYTISTTVGVFGDRFGIARLNNGTWQLVRAVLCQDLAFAGAPCNPDVAPIQPPRAAAQG